MQLVECPLCRSEVIYLTNPQPEIQDETKWKELPEHLFQKGMEIVKKMKKIFAEASPLEICVRFIREQWEILHHTGTMIPQPAMALRGDGIEKKTLMQTIVKEFNFEISHLSSSDRSSNLLSISRGLILSMLMFVTKNE